MDSMWLTYVSYAGCCLLCCSLVCSNYHKDPSKEYELILLRGHYYNPYKYIHLAQIMQSTELEGVCGISQSSSDSRNAQYAVAHVIEAEQSRSSNENEYVHTLSTVIFTNVQSDVKAYYQRAESAYVALQKSLCGIAAHVAVRCGIAWYARWCYMSRQAPQYWCAVVAWCGLLYGYKALLQGCQVWHDAQKVRRRIENMRQGDVLYKTPLTVCPDVPWAHGSSQESNPNTELHVYLTRWSIYGDRISSSLRDAFLSMDHVRNILTPHSKDVWVIICPPSELAAVGFYVQNETYTVKNNSMQVVYDSVVAESSHTLRKTNVAMQRLALMTQHQRTIVL